MAGAAETARGAPAAGSLLTPALDVRVNDESILVQAWGQVGAVEIEDDLGLPGSFSIDVLQALSASSPSTWLTDSQQFALGSKVEVLLGSDGRRVSVMIGELTALEPVFESGGLPRLTLRGYDKRHRLQRGTRTRTYQNTSDGDIVKQVAESAGVPVRSPSSDLQHVYLVQANQTDLEFLNSRAEAIGYEMVMIDGTLVFQPTSIGEAAAATIQYGLGVQELRFSLSVAALPTSLRVRAWNVAKKEPFESQAGAGSERTRMGGADVASTLAGKAFGDGEGAIVAQPAMTQGEVDARAGASFSRTSLHLMSVEGSCSGRSDLRAGLVVEIKGVGTRYGGRYYLHSVKHGWTLAGGYRTHFEGRRNSV